MSPQNSQPKIQPPQKGFAHPHYYYTWVLQPPRSKISNMRHSAFKQTLFYLVMKRSVACLIWLPKKLIFVEEIKDAKTRNFSSDFQTRVSAWFPFYFLYELLISLRIQIKRFCSINYWGSSSFPFADCNRHYQKRLNDHSVHRHVPFNHHGINLQLKWHISSLFIHFIYVNKCITFCLLQLF